MTWVFIIYPGCLLNDLGIYYIPKVFIIYPGYLLNDLGIY